MSDFGNGWWHYWSAFFHSWVFVAGFAAAVIVSDILYEIVKFVAKAMWTSLRHS